MEEGTKISGHNLEISERWYLLSLRERIPLKQDYIVRGNPLKVVSQL